VNKLSGYQKLKKQVEELTETNRSLNYDLKRIVYDNDKEIRKQYLAGFKCRYDRKKSIIVKQIFPFIQLFKVDK
jgi:hypothetical protein